MLMLTKAFWVDALMRSIRTFAQTLLAVFSSSQLNILHANISDAVGVGLGAAVISLLMSIDRSSGPNVAVPQVNSAPVSAPPAAPTPPPAAAQPWSPAS